MCIKYIRDQVLHKVPCKLSLYKESTGEFWRTGKPKTRSWFKVESGNTNDITQRLKECKIEYKTIDNMLLINANYTEEELNKNANNYLHLVFAYGDIAVNCVIDQINQTVKKKEFEYEQYIMSKTKTQPMVQPKTQ
jgi:hypothetical protein